MAMFKIAALLCVMFALTGFGQEWVQSQAKYDSLNEKIRFDSDLREEQALDAYLQDLEKLRVAAEKRGDYAGVVNLKEEQERARKARFGESGLPPGHPAALPYQRYTTEVMRIQQERDHQAAETLRAYRAHLDERIKAHTQKGEYELAGEWFKIRKALGEPSVSALDQTLSGPVAQSSAPQQRISVVVKDVNSLLPFRLSAWSVVGNKSTPISLDRLVFAPNAGNQVLEVSKHSNDTLVVLQLRGERHLAGEELEIEGSNIEYAFFWLRTNYGNRMLKQLPMDGRMRKIVFRRTKEAAEIWVNGERQGMFLFVGLAETDLQDFYSRDLRACVGVREFHNPVIRRVEWRPSPSAPSPGPP